MFRNFIAICGASAASMLGGCATITKGTTDQVTFNSEPAGATAQTSIGLQCPATPCTFEISRKQDFVVTFSKPGYVSQQVPVGTKLGGSGAAGFAGNIVAGGVIGMGVDAATGSTLDHFPNPVFVTLQPEHAIAGPTAPRKPRRDGAPKAAESKEEPTS